MRNDSILTFIVGLVIGAAGIHLGASYVIGSSTWQMALITAMIGASVWGIATFFIGWIPIWGSLFTLIIWLAAVNFIYPEGWISAAKIASIAWVVSLIAIHIVEYIGLRDVDAVGIPGF